MHAKFNTVPEMIEILRSNPIVRGLAEYGKAAHTDKVFYGDYDLFVVINPGDVAVESLHFYIGEIPVDLNIRTLQQIDALVQADGFDGVLIDARIIYDRDGDLGRSVKALQLRCMEAGTKQIDEGHIAAIRHGARHTFDKLRNNRSLPDTYKRYLLHQCVYWLLPQYFEVRSLAYRGERASLRYLEELDSELHSKYVLFYAEQNVDQQLHLAKEIADSTLEPIGGMWKSNELLTIGNQCDGENIFSQLFFFDS
jgi:hypothetical protein